jgi:hypothetical protein
MEAETREHTVGQAEVTVPELDHPESPRTATSTPPIAPPHAAATTQPPHVPTAPRHPAAPRIPVATPPVPRTPEPNAAPTTAEAAMPGSMPGGEK